MQLHKKLYHTASSQSSIAAPIGTTNHSPTTSLVNSSVQRRQQVSAVRSLQRGMNDTSRQLLAQIATSTTATPNAIMTVHGRGIRRPGCPCCDPDNASTIVDQYLSQT
jgi:hypothetical protein